MADRGRMNAAAEYRLPYHVDFRFCHLCIISFGTLRFGHCCVLAGVGILSQRGCDLRFRHSGWSFASIRCAAEGISSYLADTRRGNHDTINRLIRSTSILSIGALDQE